VVALPLSGGGWIIDTPGLRSFGLAHVTPDRVVRAFPDLAGGVAACPPGCTHLEPDCALDDWVRDQGSDPRLVARLDSLRRLLRSREGTGVTGREATVPGTPEADTGAAGWGAGDPAGESAGAAGPEPA
jgi:ribosome biogenesis GTPase